jgi:uncharacterized protein YcaQ
VAAPRAKTHLLSREHARRFLVARHLLSPPRAQTDALAVARRLGSLQVDPLAVTGLRNQDLVLASRTGGFSPARLEALLYETRDLVEVYDKGLCVVPSSDLPLHASEWRRARARIALGGGAFHDAERRWGAKLLARLEREGPLSSRELSREGKKVHAGWGPTSETRAALWVLARTGKVLTVRREGAVRWYDLAARVVPERLLAPASDDASVRHRVLSRFRAVGLLGLSPTAEVFASTAAAKERARVVRGLVSEGALTAFEVEGVRGERFVPSEDLPVLEEAARPSSARAKAALLAPLDPLIWDRTLLEPLFGTTYRWGVYTPKAKRSGGYYDLPVLFGDRIVGLCEPVFSREERLLRVARLALDEGLGKRERAQVEEAVTDALLAHAAACGAESVEAAAAAKGRRRAR